MMYDLDGAKPVVAEDVWIAPGALPPSTEAIIGVSRSRTDGTWPPPQRATPGSS